MQPRFAHFNGGFLRWLNRGETTSWAQVPEDFDPASVERTVSFLDRFFGPGRLWPVESLGLDQIPQPPVMLVSNHSGGTTIPDVWGLGWAWYRHFGTGRPLHFLAHEWVLPSRLVGNAFARLGVLWATRDTAARALRSGHDIVVFPGGDLDTWRPWHRRFEVEFGGHSGYARLALEQGVGIVPVANAGAHETLRVLSDGRRIARALSFARLARAHVFPVHLSLPWGLAFGPWPHLPWPSRMRYRFGAPIAVQRPEAVTREAIATLDASVRAAVQRELDLLAQRHA